MMVENEIFEILKKAEPYKTILSYRDEKRYIAKVKKLLKPKGIENWKIDLAVENHKKKHSGKVIVYLNSVSLYSELDAAGDIPTIK